MRFVFCAAAICHLLDYWGDVDKEKMFQFIISCIVSQLWNTKMANFIRNTYVLIICSVMIMASVSI